eukprot:Hpha_TRINITY_DN30815_c0_g1::TRINITY_DN30815_c0_g1_i1::g.155647::m.155647
MHGLVLVGLSLMGSGWRLGDKCWACNSSAVACCDPTVKPPEVCPFGLPCCDCGSRSCSCPAPAEPLPPKPASADIIVVGAGAAGAVLAVRLALSHPNLTVAVMEQGPPLASRNGGKSYTQDWAGGGATAFDIPGLYNTVAFNPDYHAVRDPLSPWTWLGKGYGGNTEFNGMLWMEPSAREFDQWNISGWKGADLATAFARLRNQSDFVVSETPSPDGKHYNNDGFDIAEAGFKRAGGRNVSSMGNLQGLGGLYYSRPSYVTDGNGGRSGSSAYLSRVLDGRGLPKVKNFFIMPNTTVSQVKLERGQAVGVEYESEAYGSSVLPLNPGGRVVLSAGAMGTARLLYLSGVGPASRWADVCGHECPYEPEVDNEAVGVVTDHVGISASLRCEGFNIFNASDRATNKEAVAQYAANRTGRYAEYPVTGVMHGSVLNASQPLPPLPQFEVFVIPIGLGAPGPASPNNATLSGPHDVGIYVMLLRPEARDYLRLDGNRLTTYTNLYLRGQGEWREAAQRDRDLAVRAFQNVTLSFLDALPQCKIGFGPGGKGTIFEGLDIRSERDVGTYVDADGDPARRLYSSHLIMNHFSGTAPLGTAVDPASLAVKGVSNLHVADMSLVPAPISAHPVATAMAIGERAAELLSKLL